MNKLTCIALTVFLSLAALGCASSRASQEDGSENTSYMNTESVLVLVEGHERGMTPMTLNVVRTRGEYEVELMKGRTLVRKFEIAAGDDQRSPERHAIYMDLARDNSGMGFRTFGLEDLESPNDTLYFIPYLAAGISIEDRKYGLTLVVTDR